MYDGALAVGQQQTRPSGGTAQLLGTPETETGDSNLIFPWLAKLELAAERNGCDGGCGLLMSNLSTMRYQVSVAPPTVRWGESLKFQLGVFVTQAQSDPGYGGPLSDQDWALIHALENDGDQVTQGQGTPGSSSSSTTYTQKEALQLAYTRDAGGRVSRQDSALMGQAQPSWSYDYDPLGRLQTATQRDPGTDAALQSSHWGYDANGNRNSENGTVIARYDAQDRLLQWKQNLYAYNAAGDLQTRTGPEGSTRYRYDALGNLLQVQLPTGQTIDYTVAPLNRRSSKTVDGQLQWQMLWNNALQPLAQLKPDGSIMSLFLYGDRPNVPEAMVKDGVSYRVLTDPLGSVRAIVDTQGLIVQQIDYDPWGRVTLDTNPGFQPFGYAGGLYDPDTALVRFGARDYDAETGRWTAKDPIGFGVGRLVCTATWKGIH